MLLLHEPKDSEEVETFGAACRVLNTRVPVPQAAVQKPVTDATAQTSRTTETEWMRAGHKGLLRLAAQPSTMEALYTKSMMATADLIETIDDLVIAGAMTVDTSVTPPRYTAVPSFEDRQTPEQRFVRQLAAMVRRATNEVPSKQFRTDMYADLAALLQEWSAR
jgi:hypothetical protein